MRRAVERHLLTVAGKVVLAEELALAFEEIAQPADHRKIAAHGVFALHDVLDEHHQQNDERDAARPTPSATTRPLRVLERFSTFTSDPVPFRAGAG